MSAPLAPHPKDLEARDAHSHDGHSAHDDAYHHTRVIDNRARDQPFLPKFDRRYANPSPLAFSALASALFIVSIVALGTDGLSSLSIAVSIALGYSSFALLVAGIWEFPTGNTFGATLYIALSGFFASLGLLLSPWSGITTAYTDAAATQLTDAIAQYFYSWFITVVVLTIAAYRSSGGLIIDLILIDFTLLFLGLSYSYPAKTGLLTAAGSFGIIASFVSWYAMLASLLTKETSHFRLPVLLDLTPKHTE